MEDVNVLKIQEICYYANERNKLNLARHRARYKRSYWMKALACLRDWERSRLLGEPFSRSKPVKWLKMGPLRIRSNILKYTAEVANLKHKIMEHTLSSTKRVRRVLNDIDGMVYYNNGAIDSIITNYNSPTGTRRIRGTDIIKYAREYELHKNIEEMLE